MFETIRSFIAELVGSEGARAFDESDYRMAATAILLHVAAADGDLGPRERERLEALVSERFMLSPSDATRLIAEARLSQAEAVGLHHFVAVLRRALDEDGRLKIVEMMWDLVYADGRSLEVEDSVVARVGQMLDISEADLATLRRIRAPGLLPGGDGSDAR